MSDKAGTRIQIFLCFLSSQKNHRDNREKISGTLKALASATFVLDYGEYVGFPGGSDGKESACSAGDLPGFDSWVGKMPWRRECLPTPVFLPEEFHGPKNLVGYGP